MSNGRLWFFAVNNGILSCLDSKTGRPLVNAKRVESLPGVYASPVAAAGKIYIVGRNGASVVIKDADALEVLATNRLDEKFDASPAIVGRELYLRGQEYLLLHRGEVAHPGGDDCWHVDPNWVGHVLSRQNFCRVQGCGFKDQLSPFEVGHDPLMIGQFTGEQLA